MHTRRSEVAPSLVSHRRALVRAAVVACCAALATVAIGGDTTPPAAPAAPPASKQGTSPAVASPRTTPPVLADDRALDYPGLHNVVAYGDGFWSGSVPEGDAGFETLRSWDVKTIISVDGAVPDVERAKPLGIRYVHLPVGYNGFDEARKLELARAVRDLEKPIYMHCHHGKHRSAGAAGAVAVSLGWFDADEAVARMKVSGTAPNYKGLYQCTAQAAKLLPEVIDAVSTTFPEVSRPTGMVESMVSIDEAVEHLKAIEKAGWKAPADHPDLVPAAEAGRLADLLRLLHDDQRVKARSEEFRMLLVENTNEAQKLEDGLVAPAPDPASLTMLFKIVNASCKECHAKFRD